MTHLSGPIWHGEDVPKDREQSKHDPSSIGRCTSAQDCARCRTRMIIIGGAKRSDVSGYPAEETAERKSRKSDVNRSGWGAGHFEVCLQNKATSVCGLTSNCQCAACSSCFACSRAQPAARTNWLIITCSLSESMSKHSPSPRRKTDGDDWKPETRESNGRIGIFFLRGKCNYSSEFHRDMTDFFGKKNETKAPAETQSPAEGSKKRARKKTKFFDEIGDEPSPAPKRKSEKKKLAKESSEIAPKENPKVKSKSKRKATEPATVELPMSPEVELVLTVSDESVDAQEVNVSVRKKRKLSAQEKKSPAENGTDYSPTSANNSLLNYFSKMSKSDTPTCKADPKPNLVKVKALVHEPPPTDSNVERKRYKYRYSILINIDTALGRYLKYRYQPFDTVPIQNIDTLSTIPIPSTLASFFTIGNRVPRPIIELSEDQKRARQNFLQSSTPANIKKIVASSGNTQPLGNPAPHPVVSHVCQRDPMHIMWNLAPVDLKLAETKELTPVKVPSWSSVTSIGSTAEPTSRSISRRASFDQKKALKDLKKEVGALPVAAWFKDLKELKKSNEGLIWSEKFKPKSVVHLTLADVQNVDKLLYWLTRLKDNSKKDSWLRTVCIVENTSVDADEIDRLIEWADSRDVRKCLLQLEFSKAGQETIPKEKTRSTAGGHGEGLDITVLPPT
ncbi:unnamed protein product [Nesidiocoris tenuis]|uniref:Uncharacterized protein n=1 Tax=Nesidiocoris tenuis TaxID=355587 RepID=A0A6H5GT84_9HEMI|nr:unnamed protein product [Nesidiocoris tenuis]